MQVAEEMGEITSSSALHCTSVAFVAGEGGGRDMERPEGFHGSPRGERGISQGTLLLGKWFWTFDPFLKSWRLTAPASPHLSAVRLGQGARAPTRGVGWIGEG